MVRDDPDFERDMIRLITHIGKPRFRRGWAAAVGLLMLVTLVAAVVLLRDGDGDQIALGETQTLAATNTVEMTTQPPDTATIESATSETPLTESPTTQSPPTDTPTNTTAPTTQSPPTDIPTDTASATIAPSRSPTRT